MTGNCVATRQWGDFQFSARLSRGEKGVLNVSVDMSEIPWPVGVTENWLEMGDRKILPSQERAGTASEHKSSNVHAQRRTRTRYLGACFFTCSIT